MSNCGQNIETITYLLVHSPSHDCERKTLIQKTHQIWGKISEPSDSTIRKYELDIY